MLHSTFFIEKKLLCQYFTSHSFHYLQNIQFMFKYFSEDSLSLNNIMLKTDLLPYKKRSEVVI